MTAQQLIAILSTMPAHTRVLVELDKDGTLGDIQQPTLYGTYEATGEYGGEFTVIYAPTEA